MVREIDHVLRFLLKAGNEIARTVLEQNNKAEGEEHKQHEPKETADQTHAAHVNLPASDGQRSTELMIRQLRSLVLR